MGYATLAILAGVAAFRRESLLYSAVENEKREGNGTTAGKATVTAVTRAAVVTTAAPRATVTEITRKANIETMTN